MKWSRDARLASQIWTGLDAARRLVLLRRWGVAATARLEFDYARHHQLSHFLPGCAKLNLLSDPHPVLCAKYHALSNSLGGVDIGYAEEVDRAWVVYYPPHMTAAGPLMPAPTMPAIPSSVITATYRAWHANNGALLGNERVFFTITELMVAGGPYDAGYFSEARHDVHPDRRLAVHLGERHCSPGPPPPLSHIVWPVARRERALRKYSAATAIGPIAHIAGDAGMEEAAQVCQASATAAFLPWARILTREFGISRAGAARRLALFVRGCFELLGDQLELVESGSDVLLIHRTSALRLLHYPGWSCLPHPIEEAFAGTWRTVSRALGDEVGVSVDASRALGADATIWRFRTFA